MTQNEFRERIKKTCVEFSRIYGANVPDQLIDSIVEQSIDFGKESVSYDTIDKCVERIEEIASKNIGNKAVVTIKFFKDL
jgi:hypothetical protein